MASTPVKGTAGRVDLVEGAQRLFCAWLVCTVSAELHSLQALTYIRGGATDDTMITDMTDYHCHLLPALDDGASDVGESIAMARILSDFGFSTVYCTPHRIRGWHEIDPSRVARAARTLQGVLDAAGLTLKLLPGGEHYLDDFLPEFLLDAPTIGTERCVLVEVPFQSGPEVLPSLVATFKHLGLTPLIAHPERCRAFDPLHKGSGGGVAFSFFPGRSKGTPDCSRLVSMQLKGCRFQGNLGSFAGAYGKEVRERALLFLRLGLYSCFGSDAHRPKDLEEMLRNGLSTVVSEIGEDAASALLAGFS